MCVLCTDTHIYFTYMCLFQFSVKFNLTFGGRGWMTGGGKMTYSFNELVYKNNFFPIFLKTAALYISSF